MPALSLNPAGQQSSLSVGIETYYEVHIRTDAEVAPAFAETANKHPINHCQEDLINQCQDDPDDGYRQGLQKLNLRSPGVGLWEVP